MAATLANDNTMAMLLEPLKPHKSAHSITKYRTMSGNFGWPKPVVAMISAGLGKETNLGSIEAMAEFAI